MIGNNPQKTDHPKIKKTTEPHISFDKLKLDLNILREMLNDNRVKEVKDLLNKLINLYESNSNIVDHIYVEQLLADKYKQHLSITKNKDNNIIKIK